MKKFKMLLPVAMVCIGLSSCGEAQVDESALNLKVQERSAVLIEQANEEYATSCEARMTTELKEKTDSIVNARKAAAAL